MQALIVNTFATFLLGVTLIASLKRLSPILHLVDHPDAVRKTHRGAVPLCGGIAILAAFFLVSFVEGRQGPLGLNFWIGLLLIVLLGLIDDRWPLPATGRLMAQLAIASLLVCGADIGLLSLGVLFPQGSGLMPLYFCVSVLFVAGLVNAWNMQDGVDGLAGGSAAVAVCWLMIVAASAGLSDLILALETLLVCICAFLVFNMRSRWRRRASVFLGDAGSTALGASIAYIILLLSTTNNAISLPALIWVVIVPVIDTLSLMVRRTLAHRSPMSADRWHLHHLLLDHGLSPSAATLTLLIVSALCGGVGYAGVRGNIPGEIMALGLIVPISLHTMFVLAASGFISRRRIGRAIAVPASLEYANAQPALGEIGRHLELGE